MKYGIPTSQGAGIFLWARRPGASFGLLHVVGNPAEGSRKEKSRGGDRMAERLILIRHGDLGDHRRGRYIGRTDAPLSAEGRRQAATLAGPLTRLLTGASVFVSPLRRTIETAECALGRGENFTVDSDIREIDFGRWEGMGFAEILAADPAAVDRWAALAEDFAFPDGESIGNFRKRIGAAAERIAADPAGTAVVVTHGGVIRFLICHFLGLPDRAHLLFDVQPASISEIRIDGGKGVLTLLNDRRHLEMD
jgi:alpha-ribazole phosphatase